MHCCVAVHVVLSTSADVCIVMEHTVRVCDWTNCCSDGDGIVVICTKAGGKCATVARAGVHISTAVTVIPALVRVLVLVLIPPVAKIMYSCVAVHAVPSTSADVCIIIKLTSISWSNYCKKSNNIAVNLTEAGRQSATVACTGVLITNAVTVIIRTLVLVLVLVLVSSIVEIMHSCVAVHAILSTSADVCIVIKLTLRDSQYINCCRDGDVIAECLTKAGR